MLIVLLISLWNVVNTFKKQWVFHENLFRLIFETQIHIQISYSLFQVTAHSNAHNNLLFNNDSYKKSLYGLQMKFISNDTFPSWPGKPVNLNIPQYQFDRNNNKFNYCLEIQLKTAEGISIWILKLFKLP